MAFYGGGVDEGAENYIGLLHSNDNGVTWSEVTTVIEHPYPVRMFEPILWYDPMGRLWLFFNQAYQWWDGRGGVWGCICHSPESNVPEWDTPIRLGDGVMATKPIITKSGECLFPISIWKPYQSPHNYLPQKQFSSVYKGIWDENHDLSLVLLGQADIPYTTYDEHSVVKLGNGDLMILARTKYGIGKSISADGGKTWSLGEDSGIPGPNSRFAIRRLQSGSLLLINHHGFTKRDHLTAMLSDDDGETWNSKLLLDERDDVSYPDCWQDVNGSIYIVYDRERYDAKELLMAVISEADIRAGKCISANSRLKVIANKGLGAPVQPWERRQFVKELARDYALKQFLMLDHELEEIKRNNEAARMANEERHK